MRNQRWEVSFILELLFIFNTAQVFHIVWGFRMISFSSPPGLRGTLQIYLVIFYLSLAIKDNFHGQWYGLLRGWGMFPPPTQWLGCFYSFGSFKCILNSILHLQALHRATDIGWERVIFPSNVHPRNTRPTCQNQIRVLGFLQTDREQGAFSRPIPGQGHWLLPGTVG